ncbi:Ig-like domain-containing protein [Aquiflexum sp. TKW24L]|uniref:Ig-like domain-containing protein n=1 Tax=Aquiflexum sp. TKW24L TaxID=2942212 RepID=UPI0020BEA226|nr:Ig-like domain-containing protein [Aquiflexum sp. TKW24L]MCL6257948.1 Ig-like domain-containing protein [Aquiflexum sp. TKW24L]
MKKIYQIFVSYTTQALAFLLLMIVFSNVGFAQEKLSDVPPLTTRSAVPKEYVQRVSSDRTPLTNSVQHKSDSPQFIQKFSQINSSPLTENEVPVDKPSRLKPGIQKGVLTIENHDTQQSQGRIAAVFCNDTPIGTNDLYVAANDKALSIAAPGFLMNDIDQNGETLTATLIVDGVDNGTLSAFPNGSFNYTPNPGFIGTDQFQYRMRNASLNESEPITVTIEVREAGNRTPIGSDDAFGALSGKVLTVAAPGFLANDIDQDGDVLTATLIVDGVDNGSLSAFPNGSFNYTPNPGFIGTDQFQYRMRDSELNESEPITVTIQVYEGNRSPSGTNDVFGVMQNTVRTVAAPGFLVNDIDPDGDALTATLIVNGVDNGSLSAFPNGSFNYTPNPGFIGTDQFQYRMRDSELNESEPITVTLEVIGPGVLPVGFPDAYKTANDKVLSVVAPGFLMNDIDQNGEPLTATIIVDGVDNGTLSAFPNGSFNYTPNPGFIGTDQFQYRMRDASSNESEPITVTIQVGEPFNRTPLGSNDQYGALANSTLVIASPGFLMNDIDQDGDVLTATIIVDGVDNGSLSAFPDGSFNYTPNAGFTGTDQFQYRMRDSELNESEPITVTIQVYEGNRVPSGTNDAFGVVKNTPLTIAAPGFLVNDFDPDGDALTATLIVDGVDNGSLSAFPDGSFNYTPNPGFTGTDQFQYRMRDSELNDSEPITVTFEVVGPNEPPVAQADDITTECADPSGTNVTLDGSNSTDPEGGALIYSWYENNIIIAGPTSSSTSDVIFTTGVHQVKLKVEDECGLSTELDIIVTVEDTTGPLVEAALQPAAKPNTYAISCNSSDVCSEVVASSSKILIPNLTNLKVSLKNRKGYSLTIDPAKNTVSVQAPNAAAFWAEVVANGGIQVTEGQVIGAYYDKTKYQFSFDAKGKLLSVKGNVVVLRCTATDGNGNTSISEATLPLGGILPLSEVSSLSDSENLTMSHQNYPNPFAGTTTIRFNLPEPAFVQINIFDHAGRLVDVLGRSQMEVGEHSIIWDATLQNSGLYIYQIQYNSKQVTNKMLLLR